MHRNDVETEEIPLSLQSPVPYRNKRKYWIAKRVMDFIWALLAIIILLPLFLVLMLVIFIDDPKGSPFFVQKRCGRHKEEFNFYKFRTMVVGADKMVDNLQNENEMDGPVFKIKDDPRITRVGKFLRRASLDELPQLFNVLKGDLCLVGPRPPLPREVAKYNEYQEQRLYITPGLTCYWQTTPHRNSLSFDEWVELDLKYIRERSFLVDFKLIFKTILVMVRCEGE